MTADDQRTRAERLLAPVQVATLQARALIRRRHGMASLHPGVVTVVVPEVSGAAARTLGEARLRADASVVTSRAAAAALTPGESAWVEDPAWLVDIPHRLDLYVVRFGVPDRTTRSALARQVRRGTARLESNAIFVGLTHRIVGFHQVELDDVPDFAAPVARAIRTQLYTADQHMPLAPTARPWVQPFTVGVHLPPRPEPVRLERSIGVFLHLFHADMAETFAHLLERVDHPASLYVSTDTRAKAEHLRAVFPDATVAVTENRGRDVRPKLYAFPGAYDRHDVVLHLHAKRSPHHYRLDAWLQDMLDCVLPSREGVNRILESFATIPDLGVVAPLPFEGIHGGYGWRHNRIFAEVLAWEMGLLPLPEDDELRFPAGSVFWARAAVLRPLVDLALTPGDFPPEAGQLDGTAAHALERLVGASARHQGLDHVEWVGRPLAKSELIHLRFADSAELGEFLRRQRSSRP